MMRPYQLRAIGDVRSAYRAGARSVLLAMPTGSGKTRTAAALIALALAKGRRVVFAAHLDALIDDTSERLAAACVEHGIVQADRPAKHSAQVQVASLATLHRRGERPPADLVIVDECHRAAAPSVRAILEAYPKARLLGLTATPQRGDGQPLGDVFGRLVCGPTALELTRQGHLVPAVVFSPPAPLDGALAMAPIEALDRYAPGEAAMVFCKGIEHAKEVAAQLGTRAVLIVGDTPRGARRLARERLAAGESLVLVGCGVFLEGWDSPEVRAVVLARAFGVCGAYLQACGRALRPAAGKHHATIVDLVGAAIMHGLPADDRVWSLEVAPRRTPPALVALARCACCLAVFHAGPAECPRCGQDTRGARLPRRATRIERAELSRLDERPQAERDAMALRGIEKRLRSSGRFPAHRIPAIARSLFERDRQRKAEAEA